MRDRIEFGDLSPLKFEEMICDLLWAEGLRDLTPQPEGTPAIDIVANEYCASRLALAGVAKIAWGVQCKRYGPTVGPDALDQITTEAEKRGIRRLLLISSSGFKVRTVERAELLEKLVNGIDKIELWNGFQLRKRLALYPSLLKTYFGVDVASAISIDNPFHSSADIKRLLDYVSEVCGVSIDSFADILSLGSMMPSERLDGFSTRTGSVLPLTPHQIIKAYLLRPDPQTSLVALDNDRPLSHYGEYREISYGTVLQPFDTRLPGVSFPIRRLVDNVRCDVLLCSTTPFVFEFVNSYAAFEHSRSLGANEYTWFLDQRISDARLLESVIRVEDVLVDTVRLHCVRRTITPERICFEFTSNKLSELVGKRVSITYRVLGMHGTDCTTLFSQLHAPARTYSFSLTCSEGFQRKPQLLRFLSGRCGVESRPLNHDRNRISFSVSGLIAAGSGIQARW